MKSAGLDDVHQSANIIIETVLVSDLQGIAPTELPKLIILEIIINRQKMRLDEIRTTHDPIDIQFIGEDFIRADIKTGHSRSIVLAMDVMLDHLRRAHTWYVNGIFKVVSKPFVQSLSIYAFVQKEGCVKQVLLLCCLMSRRRTRDYKLLLKKIRTILENDIRVEAIVSNFERTLWRAVKDILLHVSHRGCVFHWSQAVWRKMQEVGLATLYSSDNKVHKFCRKLLALRNVPGTVQGLLQFTDTDCL